MKAVFAGTFDPPTLGHCDVIERALPLFSKLYVVVASNPQKSPLLSVAQRIELLGNLLKEKSFDKKCEVRSAEGLLSKFALDLGVDYFVRGVRSSADFDREIPMSAANELLAGGAKTILIPTTKDNCFVSSSLVREIFVLGGDVEMFVPPSVNIFLKALIGSERK